MKGTLIIETSQKYTIVGIIEKLYESYSHQDMRFILN